MKGPSDSGLGSPFQICCLGGQFAGGGQCLVSFAFVHAINLG